MRRILAIGALLLIATAGVAQAAVTATVTAVSDYDFRGISLTARNPALQASVDYANDNGFYAGIWGSNADYGPGSGVSVEFDYYLGYGWGPKDGVQWNAYLIYYTDPGAKPTNIDYAEANIGATYKWFNAKLWYSWDYVKTNEATWYGEGNVNFPLPQDYGLLVHAGYWGGQYFRNLNSEYYDWAIGVTKSFGHFSLALKYINGSNLADTPGSDVFSTDPKLWLSVATTFPWGK